MKSLTSKEMSYQDKFVIENFEVGSTPLMIEAATRILDVIKIEVDDFLNKKYLLVFGPGNNGGDLLVLSRLMYSLKLDFTLLEAMPWKDISLDNKEAKEIVINYDIPIYSFEDKIDEISNNTYDVIIDGILGTGFKGELESSVLELIECLNESKGYKLSVDIPSGISGTLGVGEEFFKSHCVVTFAYLKWAHLMRKDLGKIYLGDITFPRNLSINNHSVIEYYSLEDLRRILPKRSCVSHKGFFGNVGIIGGQRQYMGAPTLCACGALRSGAGLVTTYTEISIGYSRDYEIIRYEFDDINKNRLNRHKTLVVGTGIEDINCIAIEELNYFEGNMILDGGAIELLRNPRFMRNSIQGDVIITPHIKEMARLMDVMVSEVKEAPLYFLKKCVMEYNVIVVLKDFVTYIGYLTEESINPNVFISRYGSSALSTPGSGDTLCGIIAGSLGEARDVIEGVKLGVCVHGLTGNITNLNSRSFNGRDISESLSSVYEYLENYENIHRSSLLEEIL